MNTYNFTVLSPTEFEEFIRDLLSAEHKVEYESFADGPDGGVDLRYSRSSKTKTTIVQCKRYSDAGKLENDIIKKELPKLAQLSPVPNRYIVATTVDLSKNRVDTLLRECKPYMKSADDILYPKKLNAMLARHPEIGRRHYKLWLSSTNVLQSIVQCNVENYSAITEAQITETLERYSPVPSLPIAIEKLREHGFVIIAGPPGVGKTVLAEVMAFSLLGDDENGFKEIISIPKDFNDAVALRSKDPEKHQLFLFDDFLGTNFLDNKLSRHEDSVFKSLIDHIARLKKTKALIMTTREYILHQAQQSSRHMKDEKVVDSEYILDLGTYDIGTKSKILMNHMAAANIPKEHTYYFLDNKIYRQLVQHSNYSPRLIQGIHRKELWENTTPKEFSEKLIDLFDNPWSLYEDAFKNEIGQLEQKVLLTLMSIGKAIALTDFREAVFALEKNIDETKLLKALDVLDGTFVKTYRNRANAIMVDFFNPTIQDFLVYYYKDKQHDLRSVLQSAVYLDQLTNAFVFKKSKFSGRGALGGPFNNLFSEKIVLDAACKETFEEKFVKDRKSLKVIRANGEVETYGEDIFSSASVLLAPEFSSSAINECIILDVCKSVESKNVIGDVADALHVYQFYVANSQIAGFSTENFIELIADATESFYDMAEIHDLYLDPEHSEVADKIISEVCSRKVPHEFVAEDISQRLSEDEDADAIVEEMEDVANGFGVENDALWQIIDDYFTPPEDFDAEFYSRTGLENDDWHEYGSDDNEIMDQVFGALRE